MTTAYETFRHTAQWAVSLGDEEYPGVPNRAAPVEIMTERREQLKNITGDIVSNVQFKTLPEHAVKPRDTLDGAEILQVGATRDLQDNVIYWIAYGRA